MGEVLGYDSAGDGHVLLMVHGFPLDRRMWGGQAALSEDRKLVAVDLRGRGKSAGIQAAGSSVDTYADDLAATVESLGVDRIDLAGLSMGGYVAFAFWRRHRDKVRSLILIDTKADADSDEAKQGREATADLVREKGVGALLDGLLPKIVAPDASEQVLSKLRPMFEETSGETGAADAYVMRDRPDSNADLSGIDVPTLVIHGEQDQLMPVAGAREMSSKIPGAVFSSIPDAGHMSPLENPDAVNDALRDFLT